MKMSAHPPGSTFLKGGDCCIDRSAVHYNSLTCTLNQPIANMSTGVSVLISIHATPPPTQDRVQITQEAKSLFMILSIFYYLENSNKRFLFHLCRIKFDI